MLTSTLTSFAIITENDFKEYPKYLLNYKKKHNTIEALGWGIPQP